MITPDLFLETSSSDEIITKIKTGNWSDIINGLCTIKDSSIILDNNYFKHFATKETYSIIVSRIIFNIDSILSAHDSFIVHINMKNLNVSDIDKHLKFIQYISTLFKERYQNKLTKCFIHNAPFIFSKLLNIIHLLIDKETQKKIEIVTMK